MRKRCFGRGLQILIVYIVLSITIISCTQSEEKSYLFKSLDSHQTGIVFSNTLKQTPELNILRYLYYYNGAGIGVGDFNNDGLEDLYFAANQLENHLYINRGSLKFDKVKSEVLSDEEGWTTGVTTVDINQDGWLDIYVCKVSGYRGLRGHNKLFVNQGLDANGLPFFVEKAADYGLDISSFATQASFFDYDLDGDLDMYLLNHSMHPNQNYGRGLQRKRVDSLAGDKLYRNQEGSYQDITHQTGIYQGAIGYGLGIATSDVNQDGYPDIYISNDFFENDYLYLNQKDGTFKDVIAPEKKNIQHTSHFSMGVDIADINNDGMTDILSLDMLSEDIVTYRASGTEHSYTITNQYLKNGYQPQYMQNALQLNRGNARFSEIAFYSGVAATEWSWTPLMADYDNDGFKDIFISNGILGATNDMDFINFIANDHIQKRISKGMTKEDLSLIDKLPTKKTINYFYRNKGNLTFENVSKTWANPIPSYSNGAVYVDLDNDGDLDLVTNNINDKAFVYENQLNNTEKIQQYLKIVLQGTGKNKRAIGAKVKLFTSEGSQTAEFFATRGYLSSVSSILHFGLGAAKTVDSLQIKWPNGEFTMHKNLQINTHTKINQQQQSEIKKDIIRNKVKDTTSLNFNSLAKHKDFDTKDFHQEQLIPYANSNEGPKILIVDSNHDNLEDIYMSGGRFQSSSIFEQQLDGTFGARVQEQFEREKTSEITSACFVDVDGDGDLDLIQGSGGNENLYSSNDSPVLFVNQEGVFKKRDQAFPEIPINASIVIAEDIDSDGDQDIFIGSFGKIGTYGQTGVNYLFVNDGTGNFVDKTEGLAPRLRKIGQVYDAKFADINGDTISDLIVAGHYMPITIFIGSTNGTFISKENSSLRNSKGWWNCIEVFDADQDGDMDVVAGNWGLNTRLKASKEQPIRLYLNDFDKNGKIDPITSYYYQGKEIPIAAIDELNKQLPILKKRYRSYEEFAKADFRTCFTGSKIDEAEKKEVYTLESTYFENIGDLTFRAHALPWEAQISSVNDILVDDIDEDGFSDLILGGNTYEISTQLSRLDASYGVILLNDKKGKFKSYPNPNFNIQGAVRSIESIKVKEAKYYLFGINNDSIQVVKKSEIYP